MNNKINCDAIAKRFPLWKCVACKRMEICRGCVCVCVYWILFCHLNGFQKWELHHFHIENHWCWDVAYTRTRAQSEIGFDAYKSMRVCTHVIPIYYCYYCIRRWMPIYAHTHARARFGWTKRFCIISLEQISPVYPFKKNYSILTHPYTHPTYTTTACVCVYEHVVR